MLNLLSRENNDGRRSALGQLLAILLPFFLTFAAHGALAEPFCENILLPPTSGPLPEWQSSDPYRVLGVPRSATFDQVRNAYRKLAMIYHPDHFADAELGLKIMQSLNIALEKIKKGSPLPKEEFSATSPDRKGPWSSDPAPRRQQWSKEYQAGQENRERGIVLAFARQEKILMSQEPMTRADSIIKVVSSALEIGSGWTREEVAIYLFHSYGRFATGQPTAKQLLFYGQLLRATDRFYQNPQKPDVEKLVEQLMKGQTIQAARGN